MKRLILFLLLVASAWAQTAGSAQATFFGPNVAGAGTGDVTGPASSTDNAWALWNGATGKILKDSNVTWVTPNLGVPDAFNISSAGSIALTAGGAAKSVSIFPSTTGGLGIGVAGSTGQRIKLYGASVVTTPVEGTWWGSAGLFGGFSEGSATGGEGDFVFGHASTSVNGSSIQLKKSRGTLAVPTAVSANDIAGTLMAQYFDGTNFLATSAIRFFAEGAASTGIAPAKITFQTGETNTRVGAVEVRANGALRIGVTSRTTAAWGATGVFLNSANASTVTDSSSATGTVATATFNSFNIPTINATNASVVYTNLANLYIAGDVATTGNASATNSYGLWNVGKTRLDAPIVRTPSTLTYASPTSVNVALASVYRVTTVNATGSVTFNATATGTAGQMLAIIITNDATSAKTITFGTNFTANGTLTASGASKKTTIQFISDGTTFIEVSRTVLP